MTFHDTPLPASLELTPLRELKPRDKRLDNLHYGPGIGRVKGVQNKICRDLKEGIIDAAVIVGSDGQGTGDLTGFLVDLALHHKRAYAGLLAKVLPMQISSPHNDGSRIGTVNIVSIPSGQHFSSAELQRIEQGQSTIDALQLDAPACSEESAAIVPEIEPPRSEAEDRIINNLKNQINELAQRAGVPLVV